MILTTFCKKQSFSHLPSTNEKLRAPRAPKSNSAAYKWQGKSSTSLSQAQIQCFFYYKKQSNDSIFQFSSMNSGVTGGEKGQKKSLKGLACPSIYKCSPLLELRKH